MQHGSEQLADWLDRIGLNQRDAALKLGLHYTTLNKILTKHRTVGLQVAIHLQRMTGVPVEAWAATRIAKRAITRHSIAQKCNVGKGEM